MSKIKNLIITTYDNFNVIYVEYDKYDEVEVINANMEFIYHLKSGTISKFRDRLYKVSEYFVKNRPLEEVVVPIQFDTNLEELLKE